MAEQGVVDERAVEWRLREEQGLSGAEEAELLAWLAADERHQRAYDSASWALEETARHAASSQLMAYRSAALAARPMRAFVRWRVALAAAASIMIAIGAAWTFAPHLPVPTAVASLSDRLVNPDTATYRTAVGERAVIALPDGSIAKLDTNSRLEVRYSKGERGVRLLQGQALFDVAKNKMRPFRVYAGDQRITAVGTVFNVRLDGRNVRVALVEGIVRVRSEARARATDAPANELVMVAGDMVEAAPAAPLVARPTDAKAAVSWSDGVLVFNDTALSDAVAEVNRYALRPIVIADAGIGAYRVSGVFKSSDPERFAQLMAATFALQITHRPDGSPSLAAAP